MKIHPHVQKIRRERVRTSGNKIPGLYINRNEMMVSYNSEFKDLLAKRLQKIDLNLYPDIESFYFFLSKKIRVPAKNILLTEGVSGGLKIVLESIGNFKGQNIVVPYPSFALYPVYSSLYQFNFNPVTSDPVSSYSVDDILKKVNKKTAAVFLPNPNVPIENLIPSKEIERLASILEKKGILLAIDEVYHLFTRESSIKLYKKYSNLLILRSFSKAFGLASIRLGYIVGNENLIRYIEKFRNAYETSTQAIETAKFVIENIDEVKKNVETIKAGLHYASSQLRAMNIDFVGGKHSNFIFVNLNDKSLASKIVNYLETKRIYVRSWPHPLDTGFSFTGAPKKEMELFINTIKQYLGYKFD